MLAIVSCAACTSRELELDEPVLEIHFRHHGIELDTRNGVLRRWGQRNRLIDEVPIRLSKLHRRLIMEDLDRYNAWELPDTFQTSYYVLFEDREAPRFLEVWTPQRSFRTAWTGDIMDVQEPQKESLLSITKHLYIHITELPEYDLLSPDRQVSYD
jgi:hypothetical protein